MARGITFNNYNGTDGRSGVIADGLKVRNGRVLCKRREVRNLSGSGGNVLRALSPNVFKRLSWKAAFADLRSTNTRAALSHVGVFAFLWKKPGKSQLAVLLLFCSLWPLADHLGDQKSLAPFVNAWYPTTALLVVGLLYLGQVALLVPFAGSIFSLLLGDRTPLSEQMVTAVAAAVSFGPPVLLARHFAGLGRTAGRVRQFALIMTVGFILAPAVYAAIIATVANDAHVKFADLFFEIFLGNAISIAALVPIAIIVLPPYIRATANVFGMWPTQWLRLAEFLLAVSALLSAVWASFSPALFASPHTAAYLYLSFVPALWLAFRFGFEGASFANALVSVMALLLFANFDFPNRALFKLEPFVLTLDAGTLIVGYVAAALRRSRRAKEEMERRIMEALDASSLIALQIDGAGRFVDDSEKLSRYLNRTEPLRSLSEILEESDLTSFSDALGALQQEPDREHELIIRVLNAANEHIWFMVRLLTVNDTSDDRRYLVLLDDVSTNRKEQERLHTTAYMDATTGLFNAQYLHEYLQGNSESNALAGHALLFCHFSQVNTLAAVLGHEAAEDAALQIAQRLVLYAPDFLVCRISPSDFALVIPTNASLADSLTAEEIVSLFDSPLDIKGTEVTVTPNVGVSYCDRRSSADGSPLRRAANAALSALPHGTGLIRYHDEMVEDVGSRLELLGQLSRAVEGNEFQVFYHPIVLASDGPARIAGVEALLRWFPAAGGMIAPERFVPALEQTNLINAVGRWVIRESAAASLHWAIEGIPLDLSVNVSLRQLLNANFVSEIVADLHSLKFDPKRLIVELTENVAMTDAHRTAEFISELASHNIRVAIDDFGVGNSSLARLQRFSVYSVKIDRQFVSGIGQDKHRRAFLNSIVALSKSLGLVTVAEGVETRDELNFLCSVGCDMVQGYLFAKPMNGTEFSELLNDR